MARATSRSHRWSGARQRLTRSRNRALRSAWDAKSGTRPNSSMRADSISRPPRARQSASIAGYANARIAASAPNHRSPARSSWTKIRGECRRSYSPMRANCERPASLVKPDRSGWLIRRNRYGVSRFFPHPPRKLDIPKMFVSFFPRPKLFFWSVLIWTALSMALWYGYAGGLVDSSAAAVIGVSRFWSTPFLWFYLYYVVSVAIFAGFWMVFSPHPWAGWSILGSALILFTSYFQVQVSVALNDWRGPFYNLIQTALTPATKGTVTREEFYASILTFASIATVAVLVIVLTQFFINHYIFRWRTAMNDYYVANWPRLRSIEGASQRVQEDTMRFATITERLGVSLISSVLTLIAFLPVLLRLSSYVSELPIIDAIPYPLVIAAIVWSVFGTGLLALVGIRLPGIEFPNQRVAAASAKEWVAR